MRQFCSLIGLIVGLGCAVGHAQDYSWRYYRPGNTGIQGDYCDALWIGPDNDPWIGGYVPSFEEGGLAKFVQSENRWINVSNVDYPQIGHPDNTGIVRVRDITPDAQGNLWMGTGRGVLVFNPSLGPASLVRYDASSSPWPGGWVTNIEIAPDGTVWASGYATAWGGGGLMRFNPSTSTWTYLGSTRPERLAIQPKPGGGYYVWAAEGPGYTTLAQRYDSTTQTWTIIPSTNGNPRNLPGNKCVDAAGNMWIYRVLADGFNTVLDCRRPNATWVGVPAHPGGGADVTYAFGTLQAVTDGNSQLYRFNGTSWVGLGDWGNVSWTYDVAIDSAGAVWACGVGGAAKRNPQTGVWQRYRVTNTSQYDSFNNDLTIDPVSGDVYACANAAPGVGGMVKFDGQRWIGINNLHYGLGIEWPFTLTDNSEAVHVRPSTGRIAVNPLNNFTHEYDGTAWSPIPGGPDQVQQYVEDSLGRLWGTGHYGGLGIYENGGYTFVSAGDWFSTVKRDPNRPGTVWANLGWEILRTDGTYRFSRAIDDFPGAAALFTGLAVDANGIAWIGTWTQFTSTGSTLIRLDANTGTYQMWQHDLGWPFPGEHVRPLAVTPDGRIWMLYDSEYPSNDMGLLWWDGANVGTFPAPPGGIPQWGGLPHAGIKDLEVKLIPNGYELWMSCLSRGLAVLSVIYPPSLAGDLNCDGSVSFGDINPFVLRLSNPAAYLAAFPNCPDANGDINGNGSVGFDDINPFVALLSQ
jgi:hypothetical protein